MCDYSIVATRTSPAQYDDVLETHLFYHSVGFCSPVDPDCAICLQPGTEIAFDENVKYDRFLFFFPKDVGSRLARFRKIDTNFAGMHHDALEFDNGKIIKLAELWPGQRARVLQLPVRAMYDVARDMVVGAEPKIDVPAL